MPTMSLGNSNVPKVKAGSNPLGALASVYGGNPAVSSLLSSLSQGETQANDANLAQYQNLMGAVKGLNKQVMGKGGYLDNIGVEGKNRIAENQTKELGSNAQDAMNRGIGNTTITNSLNNTTNRNAERANQELDSNLGQTKANAAMQIGGLNMNAILSRVNEGPHIDQYLGLIQSLMHNGAMQPTTQFSNMGAVSALNAPKPGGFGSVGGGTGTPQTATGQYIPPSGGGASLPMYGSGDAFTPRAGDQSFGGAGGVSPNMTAAGYNPGQIYMGGGQKVASADDGYDD